jgi:hypothetical protein
MNLYINGVKASNYYVRGVDVYGYAKVYVNDNAACHSIPSNLINNGGKCFTGGNTYEVKK